MKFKIVGALVLAASLFSEVTGQNVLENPNFEKEGGWNHWGGAKVSTAHSGDFGLKIHNPSPKWSGSDQIIILPENAKELSVSGWLKVDSVQRGRMPYERARIGVEFYDKHNKMVGGYLPVVGQGFGTRDWREYKRTYRVPKDAFSVKVQLALGNAAGTAYFDDLEAFIFDENKNQIAAAEIKAEALRPEDDIRLNQVGFYPEGPKTAVVVSTSAGEFSVVDAETDKTVYTGKLEEQGEWEHSGEEVSQANFSDFKEPGRYYISVQGLADSYKFDIKENVAHEVGKASLKSYYYQRTGTELTEDYAGKWTRKSGHPDTAVLIHPSAVSPGRPEGTKISSTRGWYDAGDYNKYIVNSGISTYTLLALYEHFPEYTDTIDVNIPESNNDVPDLLDEALFNARWMFTMQDPHDGGVYHKLTNPNFDGEIMPEDATEPRYVVQKSTAAALDYAAVMAQTARILRDYKKQYPGLADSMLTAAEKAYAWAKKNPEKYYDQSEMNEKFAPAVVTGEYGDKDVKDEFQWAAAELFASTGKKKYYKDADLKSNLESVSVPAWPNVNALALVSLAHHDKKVKDAKKIKGRLIDMADELVEHANESEFGTPMGIEKSNFVWGSNSVAANQGIILIQAHRLTGDQKYLDAAIANLDYILGRNGTGYSYVSGYGTKSMTKPHHRPSQADEHEDVIPGFIAGGPNPDQQDANGCMMPYPSKLPAVSYIDEECSYASNEVAINWNSPLTYLIFAIEASMAEQGK